MGKRAIRFVIGLAMMLTVGCFYHPLKDDPKYKEMQQLYATLPVYPNSHERDDFGGSNRSFAYYGKYYKADLNYEDLKRFYLERLPASGWKFERQEDFSMGWFGKKDGKRFNFFKGEYEASVAYVTKDADAGWDYSLDVYWRPK